MMAVIADTRICRNKVSQMNLNIDKHNISFGYFTWTVKQKQFSR